MKLRMMVLYMLLAYFFVFSVSGCDVHEFPALPERVSCHLKLNCGIQVTNITEWNHLYDGTDVFEQGLGDMYYNGHEHGRVRYIVRSYPLSDEGHTEHTYVEEFVFTKDIADGYGHDITIDLLPGNYNIMVWADIVRSEGDTPFYNAGNFTAITLQGEHQGNNNYRDAFSGSKRISLMADIIEKAPDTLSITMQRPLAKYEFVTTDLAEFLYKEQTRVDAMSKLSAATDEYVATKVNLEDYKIVFYYVGFMPHVYSLFTDKPVDSSAGVLFESRLSELSDTEASVGFDYVFAHNEESAVTVQIAIYDNNGTQLSVTDPIEVPLKRSHHTIMRGRFLMSETQGGVTINPGFNGDHNLIFP